MWIGIIAGALAIVAGVKIINEIGRYADEVNPYKEEEYDPEHQKK